jgi:transcriptional regulator with XRE-family HTH domain
VGGGFLSTTTGMFMDEIAFKKQIGLKLRKLRVIKGISRQQMADKLDMSLAGYGGIERGETDMCITRLAQVAEALETPLTDLLGGNNNTVFHINGQRNRDHAVGVHSTAYNGTPAELQHELEKQSLVLQHKEQEITHLCQQVTQLQDVIALLRVALSGGRG